MCVCESLNENERMSSEWCMCVGGGEDQRPGMKDTTIGRRIASVMRMHIKIMIFFLRASR